MQHVQHLQIQQLTGSRSGIKDPEKLQGRNDGEDPPAVQDPPITPCLNLVSDRQL
jgi:hypothetical protein